jgi:hypothetical protein
MPCHVAGKKKDSKINHAKILQRENLEDSFYSSMVYQVKGPGEKMAPRKQQKKATEGTKKKAVPCPCLSH